MIFLCNFFKAFFSDLKWGFESIYPDFIFGWNGWILMDFRSDFGSRFLNRLSKNEFSTIKLLKITKINEI